jgi:hypothetical protein
VSSQACWPARRQPGGVPTSASHALHHGPSPPHQHSTSSKALPISGHATQGAHVHWRPPADERQAGQCTLLTLSCGTPYIAAPCCSLPRCLFSVL